MLFVTVVKPNPLGTMPRDAGWGRVSCFPALTTRRHGSPSSRIRYTWSWKEMENVRNWARCFCNGNVKLTFECPYDHTISVIVIPRILKYYSWLENEFCFMVVLNLRCGRSCLFLNTFSLKPIVSGRLSSFIYFSLILTFFNIKSINENYWEVSLEYVPGQQVSSACSGKTFKRNIKKITTGSTCLPTTE